jgi:hypothetical protein
MSDLLRITERYRLDKLIHASDAASVFRAVDLRSGQTVALKLIRGEIDDSRHDGRALFESAASALRECRHPSLPRILDHGFTATGGAFLVAEYLLGASFELFAGSPVVRVLPLLLPVLDGLEELERHQLAHRNLRSDNLLVVPAGDDERLVVLGWGSAASVGGEEGRRADLRGFAAVTCAAIGAEIQHEPSVAVVMPAAAAGDPIADAPELAMLLSLLLQPGTAAPAGLYAELRRAFRQALLGDPGPAVRRQREGAGAPPSRPGQGTPASQETPAAKAAVDLDQTRAVAADVTIAVPRDRLLGALDRMSAAGAAAAGGAEAAAAAAPAGGAAAGDATAPAGVATAAAGVAMAGETATAGAAALAGRAAAADDAPPAASAATAGPELRLVSPPAPPAPGAGAVRGDTLPVFRPEDLGGAASGAEAGGAPAAASPGLPLAVAPGTAVPGHEPAPAPPLRPAAVTPMWSAHRRAAATTRLSRQGSPLQAALAAHPMAAAEERPSSRLDSLPDAAQEAGQDLGDSREVPDPGTRQAADDLDAGSGAAPAAAASPSPSPSASAAVGGAGAKARPRELRGRAGQERRRWTAAVAGIGIVALAAVAAVAYLRQPAARRQAATAANRRPGPSSTLAPAGPRHPAAPPAAPPGTTAPAAIQPALDPHLQAAEDLLAGGDSAGARRELALVSTQQQAGYTPAEREAYDRLGAALATDRRRQIAADLAAALRRGDIRRINAALTAAKWEPELPAATRRDLDRARQAVELDARLERTDLAQAPQEALRNATDLLTLLPRHRRAGELRDQAAKAIEDQADAALAAGDGERAAALLAGLRQAWPERSGLQDRFERLETQRRGDSQLEAVLAGASRAEAAAQPLQGLELLAGVNPGGRYRERFRRQRERLEELLARLDAAPPAIALRPGFKLEYEKGARIAVPLRITDDLAVKSAECWVRPEGAASYQLVPVRHLSGADYEVDIPPELHQNRTVDLYAAASDNSGHRSLLGSRDQPLKLKRRSWIEKIFTGKDGGRHPGSDGGGPAGPPPP